MSDRWDTPMPAELAIPAGEVIPPSDEDVDLYFAASSHEGTRADNDQIRQIERTSAFRLDNDSHAQHYMAKMAATARELRTVDEQAQAWKDRIDEWRDKAVGAIERRRTWWQAHLIDYAIRRREAMLAADPRDARAKTLDLPSGKVSTTHRKPAVKVTDPDALVEWLDNHFDGDAEKLGYVKVTEAPVLAQIKAQTVIKGDEEHGYTVLLDGEPVDGVAVEGENVTATVHPE